MTLMFFLLQEEHDDSSALIGDNTKTELTSGDTGSGTKRKRNSYSDSPHKLRCQYCPRAFPWISSLKRHLLTHTGTIIHHAVIISWINSRIFTRFVILVIVESSLI